MAQAVLTKLHGLPRGNFHERLLVISNVGCVDPHGFSDDHIVVQSAAAQQGDSSFQTAGSHMGMPLTVDTSARYSLYLVILKCPEKLKTIRGEQNCLHRRLYG